MVVYLLYKRWTFPLAPVGRAAVCSKPTAVRVCVAKAIMVCALVLGTDVDGWHEFIRAPKPTIAIQRLRHCQIAVCNPTTFGERLREFVCLLALNFAD